MSQRYLGGFNKPGYDPLAANVTTGAITVQDQGVFTMQAVEAAQGAASWNSDPNFNSSVLLIQADGVANNANNATFLDSSANNFALTRVGATTQGSFSPFSSGQWSYISDNVGDYARVPSSAALAMGTGDFTIEVWTYFYAVPANSFLYDQRIAAGSLSPFINIASTATIFGFGATNAISSTVIISAGVWTHIAVSRVSGVTRLFMGGTQIGSSYTDTNNYVANLLTLGARWDLANLMQGFMSNLRVLKGTGLYTTNFVPPTEPLTAITNTALLTFQNSYFKDNSVNNATITSFGDAKASKFTPYPVTSAYDPSIDGGSGYFNGTTDYLTNAAGAIGDFGTGDFTIEYWWYQNAATNAAFNQHLGTAVGTAGLAVGLSGTGTLYATTSSTGFASTIPISLGQWQHIAWVRQSGSLKAYKNGVLGYTVALATNFTETGTGIGASKAGAFIATAGYMASARVVKGIAVYTANFTPPVALLTATQAANVNGSPSAAISSGTSLLLKYTNASLYDATKNNNLILTTAVARTTAPFVKYGSGSVGNGYLTIPNTTLVSFGTSNFTIEGWIYFTTFAAVGILDTRISATSTSGIAIQLTATGSILITINNATLLTTSMAIGRGWTHLAVVKANGVVYVYINGKRGITSSAASTTSLTDNFLFIKSLVSGTVPNATYMDDIRITNGVARYTAPYFTPPPRGFAKQ